MNLRGAKSLWLLMPALCVGVVCWIHPPSRISVPNANRIKQGMTLADVEAILGPARDETGGAVANSILISPPGVGSTTPVHWINDELVITVSFDRLSGIVSSVGLRSPLVETPVWQRYINCMKQLFAVGG